MKKTLILSILFTLTLSGCASTNPEVEVVDNKAVENSVFFSEESQDAEFNIAYGWTGGMGSMPVLNEAGGVYQYNDWSIYLDESYYDVVSEKLPGCIEGTPEITIFAKVYLQESYGINYSLPPTEDGDEVVENYYDLMVDELYNIEVKAEECED